MTDDEKVIEWACIELDMSHGEKEWPSRWARLIALARAGAAVQTISLDAEKRKTIRRICLKWTDDDIAARAILMQLSALPPPVKP